MKIFVIVGSYLKERRRQEGQEMTEMLDFQRLIPLYLVLFLTFC